MPVSEKHCNAIVCTELSLHAHIHVYPMTINL